MPKIGKTRLEKVAPRCNRKIQDYKKFIDPSLYHDIEKLAKDLQGLRVLTLNATPWGGGVAEILHSLVPLMNSVGVKVDWYTIKTQYAPFFDITKSIHNQLQGQGGKLTDYEKKIYDRINQELSEELMKLKDDYDVMWLHDPQPLASWALAKKKEKSMPPAIWRCHIDTSNPNRNTWAFLKKHVQAYDAQIYTLPEYAQDSMKNSKGAEIRYFAPTIDPLDTKILPMTLEKARKTLRRFGVDTKRPIVAQISRFDIWKDPWGVVDAYRKARKEIPGLILMLVGPLANDDPEAMDVYTKLIKYIEGVSHHEDIKLDRDVFLLSNQDGFIFKELNALYTAGDVIIQKSLVEGFGLVVTEANWKAKPVIGGDTGGIRFQIQDYRRHKKNGTGILVDVEQLDHGVDESAEWIVKFFKDKKLMRQLGRNAQKRVRENFLHPHAVRNYFQLFSELTNGRK